MCYKAVDTFLSTLNFVPVYWFVTSKMIKKLYNAFSANDNILFFDEDSGNVIFQMMKWIFLE